MKKHQSGKYAGLLTTLFFTSGSEVNQKSVEKSELSTSEILAHVDLTIINSGQQRAKARKVLDDSATDLSNIASELDASRNTR